MLLSLPHPSPACCSFFTLAGSLLFSNQRSHNVSDVYTYLSHWKIGFQLIRLLQTCFFSTAVLISAYLSAYASPICANKNISKYSIQYIYKLFFAFSTSIPASPLSVLMFCLNQWSVNSLFLPIADTVRSSTRCSNGLRGIWYLV